MPRAPRLLLAALVPLALGLSAAEPVAVGGGSYAPYGGAVRDGDAEKLFAQKPQVEPELLSRPMPTNSWWTTLLTGPFPGKLYAMPATVDAGPAGVRVWFPQGWNDNGTELAAGRPLEVQGVDRAPASADVDLPLASFEGGRWPEGWSATGDAWGDKPTAFAARAMGGAVGGAYACSFALKGDRGQGELVSPAFAIARERIHLQVGGGSDKGRLHVDLEVDGKAVRSAAGRNSNDFAWITWEVKEFAGKQARLRLVDAATGGWGFLALGRALQSNAAQPSSGGVFSSCTAARWSDWSVTMRLRAAPQRSLDATIGRGMPYVWVECHDLDLRVPRDGDKLTDLAGKDVTLPVTGDSLVLERDGRLFGLFAPAKTVFSEAGGAVEAAFAGKERFLVVGLLPRREDAALLARHAYAVPRDTRVSWAYDREAGAVTSTFTTTADALRGTDRTVLQGWLPHHWREGQTKAPFAATEFASQRGRLRLAPGNTVAVTHPFTGLLPALPMPAAGAGDAAPFDAKRFAEHLQRWTDDRAGRPAGKRYGDDTYWGAKDFLLMAQHLAIARAGGHPAADKLRELLADCLGDWLTWTPGEGAHYFARYPAPWQGLVGMKSSFGSGAFTDNHFHFGYFTLAAALLIRDDAQRGDGAWAAKFAPMARLVAKQYANWEREDQAFPFLRCFDPWAGHCYAGGTSDRNDGNNQESSSEAMQAWAGLFLLGAALGDDAMLATGAMGYAVEGAAIAEYWNDYHAWKDGPAASNYTPKYKHTIVSVLRDRDIGYWTWFSGEPIHIYGIQWLPQWTSLQYLARDPEFTAWQVTNMLTAQGKGTPVTFVRLGDDWGNVALGGMLFGDPDLVARTLADAAAANDPLAGWQRSTVTTYLAHAYRQLGQVAWDCHATIPTSTVFVAKDGKLTVVAWNPGKAPVTAAVQRAGKKIGQITVPPGALQTTVLP
jgi:hypothetical protein